MRVLLVVLALAVMSGDVLAEGAAWQRKRVVIWGHAEGWNPVLAEAIATINGRMPKRVPRLKHRPREAPCVRHRKGISVCEDAGLSAAGMTIPYRERSREITRTTILLRPFAEFDAPLILACHELFHALTGIGSHGEWVWEEPCPFDEQAARRVYRKHGRR